MLQISIYLKFMTSSYICIKVYLHYRPIVPHLLDLFGQHSAIHMRPTLSSMDFLHDFSCFLCYEGPICAHIKFLIQCSFTLTLVELLGVTLVGILFSVTSGKYCNTKQCGRHCILPWYNNVLAYFSFQLRMTLNGCHQIYQPLKLNFLGHLQTGYLCNKYKLCE